MLFSTTDVELIPKGVPPIQTEKSRGRIRKEEQGLHELDRACCNGGTWYLSRGLVGGRDSTHVKVPVRFEKSRNLFTAQGRAISTPPSMASAEPHVPFCHGVRSSERLTRSYIEMAWTIRLSAEWVMPCYGGHGPN